MAKLSQPPSLAQRWQTSIGDHVIALAWSPDGALLAAGSVSGPIAIFDTASGSLRHSLKGHGFGATSLRWQPGGRLLASSGQDGKVRF
jgi:WD40 repeat protein